MPIASGIFPIRHILIFLSEASCFSVDLTVFLFFVFLCLIVFFSLPTTFSLLCLSVCLSFSPSVCVSLFFFLSSHTLALQLRPESIQLYRPGGCHWHGVFGME
jgi:hypothetical protein